MINDNRKDLTKPLQGSLQDVSESTGKSITELLMEVDHMIVVDTSYSMTTKDAGTGQEQRHDVALKELESLQSQLSGKIAVISGSIDAIFCPTGIPIRQDHGTNFFNWLTFIKNFDGTGIKFYLVSDGEDYGDHTIELAGKFETPINCIYVGPERGASGISFLRQISDASRGKYVESVKVGEFKSEFKALAEVNN
jgi:hypothetical protein